MTALRFGVGTRNPRVSGAFPLAHSELRTTQPKGGYMPIEKLGYKPTEYGITNEPMTCEACGKTISPGEPFLVKRSIKLYGGEYVLNKSTECVRACSSMPQGQEMPTYVSPLRLHESIEDLPARATDKEKTLKFQTVRGGTWVATGYQNIVGFRAGTRELAFLECSEFQVQRKAFTLDPQNKDSFGGYQSWRTRDGLTVREYQEDNRDCRADFWYMPLDYLMLMPEAAPRIKATTGGA